MRQVKHELKNTFFYIDSLVKQRDYATLERYLDTELSYRLTALEEIDTGNPTLDLVLMQKVAEARQAHINVVTNLSVPANLPFRDQDVCALMLNLLDNAIDASKEQPDGPDRKEIRIAIAQAKNFLHITISNRIAYDVLQANAKLHTSKADKENHGIGLRVVRSIVKRYSGLIDFSTENHYFTVNVLLQFPEKPSIA
ncbi:ATP-binding protein [Bifidobacterium lemurum]|uniref:ATP-binding protein n=1 Tax=Bifidobacterium lemurum TaxID=1603886 RepID=UPI001303DFDE|nr:ATP-binding protein [Bifidobacterium lemurum]